MIMREQINIAVRFKFIICNVITNTFILFLPTLYKADLNINKCKSIIEVLKKTYVKLQNHFDRQSFCFHKS